MGKYFRQGAKGIMALLICGLAFVPKLEAIEAPPAGTATLHVSASKGTNRNDGSKEKPIKDLQKAINDAPEGAVILVAA